MGIIQAVMMMNKPYYIMQYKNRPYVFAAHSIATGLKYSFVNTLFQQSNDS